MHLLDDYTDISIEQAKFIQNKLSQNLQIKSYNKEIKIIGGADISFNRFSNIAYACIVLLDFNTLAPINISLSKGVFSFPYIPGYLSFREIPTLLKAWNQIDSKPDMLIIDGHGISHPKEMGIATHFGIVTNQPTIGCAKKKLCGNYKEPNIIKNSINYLNYNNKILGAVLRSKTKVKPIFISPGNKIDLKNSIEITKKCITKYRLPEPTRLAHKFVNAFRTGALKEGYIKGIEKL